MVNRKWCLLNIIRIHFLTFGRIRIEKFHNLKECQTLGRQPWIQSGSVCPRRKFDARIFYDHFVVDFLIYCLLCHELSAVLSKGNSQEAIFGTRYEATKNVRSACHYLLCISPFDKHTRKNYIREPNDRTSNLSRAQERLCSRNGYNRIGHRNHTRPQIIIAESRTTWNIRGNSRNTFCGACQMLMPLPVYLIKKLWPQWIYSCPHPHLVRPIPQDMWCPAAVWVQAVLSMPFDTDAFPPYLPNEVLWSAPVQKPAIQLQ